MTRPPRLRDSESAPRLLRLALDAVDDEPSVVDLHALGAGLGIGAFGSIPLPATQIETSAAGSLSAKSGWFAAKAATLGTSKIIAFVAGPAFAGALAGGAVLTAAVSMQSHPGRQVSTAMATVALQPQPEPVHHVEPTPVDPTPAQTVDMTASNSPPQATASAVPPPTARTPSAAIEAAQPVAPAPASVPQVARETEAAFLDRAKGLVESDPDRAFALASEHTSRFPKGMLQQEAEVIAIEALARRGLLTAAADRLTRFQQRFPSSFYLPHLATVVRHPK